MQIHRLAHQMLPLCLAVAAAACSKSSSAPTQSANTTTVTYTGVFAGQKEGGAFTISAEVPAIAAAEYNAQVNGGSATATGTLKIAGGAAIPLTGTYNTATGVFTLSGSSYSLTATVASNAVSGTYTGPSTSGTLVALPVSSTVNVTPFCGTYAGSESGRWNVAISAGKLTGVASSPDGAIALTGTLSGVTMTMSWHPNATDFGNATGTLNGTTVAGTWLTNTPGSHGTWTGSSGSC